MSSQKQCIDFYGERLNIGDEVIPMMDEALHHVQPEDPAGEVLRWRSIR